jgi:hypothetical protein
MQKPSILLEVPNFLTLLRKYNKYLNYYEINALNWNITHKSRPDQTFLPQRCELFALRTQNFKEKPFSISL